MKEPGIRIPDGHFKRLVCHLLGQPAFRTKLNSLAQHLISQIHWCLLWRAERAWTGNREELRASQMFADPIFIHLKLKIPEILGSKTLDTLILSLTFRD